MAFHVRLERPEDAAQVFAVIEAAFEDRSVAESAEMRPDRPRRGIGAALVRDEPLMPCAGVPAYCPQVGFGSATELGLLRPNPRIPDAVWMVAPLRAYDPTLRGRVVYPPFFPGPPADA